LIPASDGPTESVAVSLRAPETAARSRLAAMASTGHFVKSSLGTWRSIDFHRVECRSTSTEAARGTTLVYFTDAESNVCPPLPNAIRGALFSEWAATNTENELVGLRAGLLFLKRALAAAEAQARAEELAVTPAPTPHRVARRDSHSPQVMTTVESFFELKEDDDELVEGSGDEDDPLMEASNAFARQAGAVSSTSSPAAAGAGEAAGKGPDLSGLIQVKELKVKKAAKKAKTAAEKGERE
jgi:hypothetical protein